MKILFTGKCKCGHTCLQTLYDYGDMKQANELEWECCECEKQIKNFKLHEVEDNCVH